MTDSLELHNAILTSYGRWFTLPEHILMMFFSKIIFHSLPPDLNNIGTVNTRLRHIDAIQTATPPDASRSF
jgi:hypothetical protein